MEVIMKRIFIFIGLKLAEILCVIIFLRLPYWLWMIANHFKIEWLLLECGTNNGFIGGKWCNGAIILLGLIAIGLILYLICMAIQSNWKWAGRLAKPKKTKQTKSIIRYK